MTEHPAATARNTWFRREDTQFGSWFWSSQFNGFKPLNAELIRNRFAPLPKMPENRSIQE